MPRKDLAISASFPAPVYLPLLFIGLLVVRKLSARLLGPIIFNRMHRCGAIVIGSSKKAEKMAAWVETKSDLGLEAVGWLADNPKDLHSDKLPRLGSLRELEAILISTGASVVLVADFLNARLRLPWLRAVCDRCGVRLAFSIDFGESLPCNISCYQEDGMSVVTLRDEPLESPFNRALKRFLDIMISLPVVLFVLPPLALLVRLLQGLQSPGPLMFSQERVGLYGRKFTIYKFRTMGLVNSDEAVQVQENDGRIFPAGKWLRRLSLDEFPQFLNVLQGSMSIVGPRPHMGLHDVNFAKVASLYRLRSLIKPGITGLAQVLGYRGPTNTVADVLGRTNSDLYYLENWSLRLDVTIILRTFLQFIRHERGARPEARRFLRIEIHPPLTLLVTEKICQLRLLPRCCWPLRRAGLGSGGNQFGSGDHVPSRKGDDRSQGGFFIPGDGPPGGAGGQSGHDGRRQRRAALSGAGSQDTAQGPDRHSPEERPGQFLQPQCGDGTGEGHGALPCEKAGITQAEIPGGHGTPGMDGGGGRHVAGQRV